MADEPVGRRADRGRANGRTAREGRKGALDLPEPERIRAAVLTALERRRRTRRELETMLRRKGFSPAATTPVLDRLTEVGLIDDLEYARVYLERRAAAKPRGASLLRGELLARGIGADLVERVLRERAETADPVADALRVLHPWLSRRAALEPRERRRKASEFLARRGFSYDVIERAWLRAGEEGDEDHEG